MVRSTSPSICVSRRGLASNSGDVERTVVWLRGDHDISTRKSLAVTIARAARMVGDVVVDLSGVTFMDASTVNAIVDARNQLEARSQLLEVRAPSPAAFRTLELCELTGLVPPGVVGGTRRRGAAALSTWVDVPATESMSAPPDVPVPEARTTREVVRGGR